jgi:ketosteroid isomerase-like protein
VNPSAVLRLSGSWIGDKNVNRGQFYKLINIRWIAMTTTQISVAQVEDAVRRYWRILMEKLATEMSNSYTYDAVVFNPFSARLEPGRVSAARKEREYFTPQTKFHAEIIGPVNVQLLADTIAVASYQFRWHATNMEQKVLGKKYDKAVREGRATQVFVINPEGKLLIVNEHLSDIWRDSVNNDS